MTFNKKWISGFLFIFFLITTWVMLHSSPIVHIKLVSPVQSTTKIFYRKTHDGYIPDFSVQAPLAVGEQTISFKPGKMHRFVRWDLANKPGNFLVKDIWIEVCTLSFKINVDALSPNNQIASLTETPQGLSIKTTADASVAQVLLPIPFQKIYWVKYLFTILTIVLAGAFLICSKLGSCFLRMIEKNFSLISEKYKERGLFSLGHFAILVIITCIFYWYFLSHFYLLIDDELSAFRAIGPNGSAAWIGQGRWLSYLLAKYVLIQPIVPYVQNVFFCISMALSYMFIVNTYRLKDRALIYFTYPLFCAFPVWFFIVAFYANIASVSAGILFVSAAIFIFDCYKDSLGQMRVVKLNFFALFGQALLLAMAIAAYQSFILIYAAMGIGLILFSLMTESNKETTLGITGFNLLYLIIIMILGLLLYSVVNEFLLWLIPSDTTYIKGLQDWQALFQAPGEVIYGVLRQVLEYYSGTTIKYGAFLSSLGILIALSSIASFFSLWKRANKKIFISCLILWTIILLTPFALNLISAGTLNTRILLAIPFVIWFVTVMALTMTNGRTRGLIFAVFIFLEIQMLQVIGLYAAATDITGNHDRALAASLYERVGMLSKDGCSNTPCVVDVYGLYHITTPYPMVSSSTMGASFFEWDGGNIDRMLAFMRLLGYTNLVALDPQNRADNTALFEKMPVWPAAGSVIKSKDIYLIKLSNMPDPAHVKQ